MPSPDTVSEGIQAVHQIILLAAAVATLVAILIRSEVRSNNLEDQFTGHLNKILLEVAELRTKVEGWRDTQEMMVGDVRNFSDVAVKVEVHSSRLSSLEDRARRVESKVFNGERGRV